MKPILTALLAVGLTLAPAAARAQAAAPVAPAAAAGDTQSVETTGEAVILLNDRAMAKERAVEDALRQAVEQVAGTIVSAGSLVQNAMLVEDTILTQAKGYVKGYKILREAEERGALRVTIQAEVQKTRLTGDLDRIRAQLEQFDYPRVLVLISEENVTAAAGEGAAAGVVGVSTNLGVVENAFIEAWEPKGFRFIDRQAAQGRIANSPVLKVLSANLTQQQIDEIANLTDAQIIVYGKAVTNQAGSVMGTQLISSRSNISVRVINADNAEVIATETAQGGAAHIDPTTAGVQALTKAVKVLCDKLAEKIVDKWSRSTRPVALEVEGVKNMATLTELKHVLRSEVRGVRAVRERSFTQALVSMDLDVAGRTTALAAELEGKPFEKLTIKVLSRSANKLRIQVVAK